MTCRGKGLEVREGWVLYTAVWGSVDVRAVHLRRTTSETCLVLLGAARAEREAASVQASLPKEIQQSLLSAVQSGDVQAREQHAVQDGHPRGVEQAQQDRHDGAGGQEGQHQDEQAVGPSEVRLENEGDEPEVVATRVEVERQTHLPATRDETWTGLRLVVPDLEWRECSAVFAAMESIYRCAQGPTQRAELTSMSI